MHNNTSTRLKSTRMYAQAHPKLRFRIRASDIVVSLSPVARHSAPSTDTKFKTTKRISVCTISIATQHVVMHRVMMLLAADAVAAQRSARRQTQSFCCSIRCCFFLLFDFRHLNGASSWILANGNKRKRHKRTTVDFLIQKYGSAFSCINRFIWIWATSVVGDDRVGDIFAIPIQRLNGWHKQQGKIANGSSACRATSRRSGNSVNVKMIVAKFSEHTQNPQAHTRE